MAMFTPAIDSASAMSRLRARTGCRRSNAPAVGAFARQQRLNKGLLQALHVLGPDGLAALRARPAERQRRPSAITDRILKLSDHHIAITQALLDQRGLWDALAFAYEPQHLRTEHAPALFLALGLNF